MFLSTKIEERIPNLTCADFFRSMETYHPNLQLLRMILPKPRSGQQRLQGSCAFLGGWL